MNTKLLLLIMTLATPIYLGFATNVQSQDDDKSKPSQLNEAEIDKVRKNLQTMMASRQAGIQLNDAKYSSADGILQMKIEGGPLLYVTDTGSHFFVGDLYEINESSIVNITEQEKNIEKIAYFSNVKPGDYISFAPVGEVKGVINVFTDTTCGYCRKLHNEMTEMNVLGIEVRYFAFPRAGVGSGSYNEMVSIWCADNPHLAMTTAKTGGKVAAKTCNNPVAEQYNRGQAMGVTGTPAIFLETGQLIPGYRPAKQMAEILGIL